MMSKLMYQKYECDVGSDLTDTTDEGKCETSDLALTTPSASKTTDKALVASSLEKTTRTDGGTDD